MNETRRLVAVEPNSVQARDCLLSFLAGSIPFLHIVYGICMKALNTFSCLQLRDCTLVLWIAPEVVCWEAAEHWAMVALSVLAILVYVIGIPAYVFCTMWYAHRKDKLKDPKWRFVLGFLYERCGTHATSHRISCRVGYHGLQWNGPRRASLACLGRRTYPNSLSSLSLGLYAYAEPHDFLWELAFLGRRARVRSFRANGVL